MTPSVVLARIEPPTPEAIVAGRQSYSERNRNAAPTVISKAGAQTAVALPERVYNPYANALRIAKVIVSLGTAPAGSTFVVDVKVNGTSVFAGAGTRAIVATGANTGSAVPDKTDTDTALVKPGQYVTAEVTQIGSGTAGSDLRVTILYV